MIERTATIDVLIPSRQRAALLDHSVQSLHDTAARPERVNFLVVIDHDDPEGRSYSKVKGINCYISVCRYGYRRLHEYYNLLAEDLQPTSGPGDWLFIWNDDAVMLTQSWDEVIAAEDHTVPNVLNFTGALNLFPPVKFSTSEEHTS